eukprot:gene12234-25696_t
MLFKRFSNIALRDIKIKLYSTSKPNRIEHDFFNRPGPWDDKNLDSLLEANKRWAARMAVENPKYFENNKIGNFPKILWIGCSDARVPANDIIGEAPGSVFVHRNIANMVVSTDFNCMSVIQYAVDILKVKHIIVCGHYDCGGVKAAMEQIDHKSPLENWLRNIRDTFRLHKDEILVLPEKRDRQRRLVELNVIEQCMNLFKTAVVQRRRVETYKHNLSTKHSVQNLTDAAMKTPAIFTEPQIHAFVFEPTTGEAKRLDVNFTDHIKGLREVYDLYDAADTTHENVIGSVSRLSCFPTRDSLRTLVGELRLQSISWKQRTQ